jgi:hypothetical protein
MRWLQAAQQVLNVCVTVLVVPAEHRVLNQPGVRNQFHDAVNEVWREPLGHLRVYLSERAAKLEEDVVFDHGQRVSAAFAIVVP